MPDNGTGIIGYYCALFNELLAVRQANVFARLVSISHKYACRDGFPL